MDFDFRTAGVVNTDTIVNHAGTGPTNFPFALTGTFPAGTGPNVLYYDSVSGAVTYGAGGGGGGSSWLIGGQALTAPGILGSNNAFAVSIESNGIVTLTSDAAGLLFMPTVITTPAVGGEKILMIDPATGQLRISP